MKNKYVLKGFVHIIGIIMLLLVVILVFAIYVLPHLIDGRIGITLPWGFSIMSDPTRKELLQYMNDKYNTEFIEITEEDYTKAGINKNEAVRWSDDYNGIIVRTKNNHEQFYYVRKNKGKITDNYGCCLVQDEAQKIIHDKLSDTIDYDFKIACRTNEIQNYEYSTDLTPIEYIGNCSYNFFIYICSDGETREQDYKKLKPQLNELFNGTPKNSDRVTIVYLEKEYFDRVIISRESADFESSEHSNCWGYGYVDKEYSEFKWFDENEK